VPLDGAYRDPRGVGSTCSQRAHTDRQIWRGKILTAGETVNISSRTAPC
jgi:hypothetical protein